MPLCVRVTPFAKKAQSCPKTNTAQPLALLFSSFSTSGYRLLVGHLLRARLSTGLF